MPMLVLSRKPGEVIVVPQCALSVTVLAVNGNKVRLGIAAPDEISVYREEVWRNFEEPPKHSANGAAPMRIATDKDREAFWDEAAAQLTDAVYPVMLRHGVRLNWLDLELDLWNTMTETVKKLQGLEFDSRPQELPTPSDVSG
jgi:carbon storage regulator